MQVTICSTIRKGLFRGFRVVRKSRCTTLSNPIDSCSEVPLKHKRKIIPPEKWALWQNLRTRNCTPAVFLDGTCGLDTFLSYKSKTGPSKANRDYLSLSTFEAVKNEPEADGFVLQRTNKALSSLFLYKNIPVFPDVWSASVLLHTSVRILSYSTFTRY